MFGAVRDAMLRIEVDREGNALRAMGRLAGPWVQELARAIASLDGDQGIELDLTDVPFADADGVAMLRQLCHARPVNLHCSVFLAALLA